MSTGSISSPRSSSPFSRRSFTSSALALYMRKRTLGVEPAEGSDLPERKAMLWASPQPMAISPDRSPALCKNSCWVLSASSTISSARRRSSLPSSARRSRCWLRRKSFVPSSSPALQLTGQGGLGHMEQRRCLCHVFFPGYCQKVAQNP